MRDEAPPPGRLNYLKQADQAREMAARATSPDERKAFHEIERLWRQLAERGGGAKD